MAYDASRFLIDLLIGTPAKMLQWATQSSTHTIAMIIGLIIVLIFFGLIIKAIKD